MAVGAAVLAFIGAYAPPAFMQHLIAFVLAIFVGFQVVWNVAPLLSFSEGLGCDDDLVFVVDHWHQLLIPMPGLSLFHWG